MQDLAQSRAVVERSRRGLLQRDQDLAVVVGDEGAVAEREIVVARRQADVVEDDVEILLGVITLRIVSSTAANFCVAVSIRMPGRVRTCSVMLAGAICGK